MTPQYDIITELPHTGPQNPTKERGTGPWKLNNTEKLEGSLEQEFNLLVKQKNSFKVIHIKDASDCVLSEKRLNSVQLILISFD